MIRFLTSLVEQGMGAAVTFGINLWLIRNGEAQSYGVYVFWYAVAWVLATCQFTLTVVHLSALPSGSDRLAERREPERVLLSATLLFLAFTAVGTLAANLILRGVGSELYEVSAIGFIPEFLLYQYARAFAFSRKRVGLAAMMTGAVMFTSAIGLGLDELAGFVPAAPRVLTIVGLSYGICGGVGLYLADRRIRPVWDASVFRRYTGYLAGSGWVALGAGSSELVSRFANFIVVAWFGSQALARLSSVQVVIRPAWMLSAAWMSVGFPAMSTCRANGDRAGLRRAMLLGGGVTALGSAIWSGIVIVGWPWISAALYRGRYADIGLLGWLWGGNVLLGSIALALNCALLVLREFKHLALIDLVGGVVCVGASMMLLSHYDYTTSVIGTMAGQATQIALMAIAVGLRLRAPRKAGSVAGPATT